MTRHFLYLILTGARNSMRRQLRRLRSPRYAIAVLFGLGYFFLVFGGMQDPETRHEVSGITISGARMLGPLLLGVIAAWWWLWGGHRHGVLLSPAETHLLLPAPISRRELIRYKIMNAQGGILFSALMGSLLTTGATLPFPLRLLGLWVMIATLHLHQVAASLVHAAAQEQGRRGIRRNLVPLVLFSAAFVTLLAAVLRAIADIRRASSMDGAMERLVAVVGEPGPRIVLAPFRLLLAPAVAPDFAAWAQAFAAAAGVLLLHYFWVQHTNAAFEETAAEQGALHATRQAAVRSGGLARLRFTSADRPRRLAQPWLPMAPTGRAAWGVVWKNVLLAQRGVRVLVLLVPIFAMLAMISFGEAPGNRARFVGFLLLAFTALATIGGPLAIRLDLRVDLRYLDLLRTYPVAGRDLVAAGITASTLVITAMQLALGVPALVLLGISGLLTPLQATGAVLALLLCGPAVNALGVSIQNAIALLYPGWSQIGEARTGGIETVGQNMLTLIGTVIMLLLALIPAVIAAAIVGGVLSLVLDDFALVPAALAAVVVIAAEVVLGVIWLGSLYDSTDPVEAGLLAR